MAITEYQLLDEWGGERYVQARENLADWYKGRSKQNLPPVKSFDEVKGMSNDAFELFKARVHTPIQSESQDITGR